jgi:ribose 5-phosphate isomerase A
MKRSEEMGKLIEVAKSMIKPQMTVSFGGGRTVSKLVKSLVDIDIQVSTPSEMTRELCLELNIPVISIMEINRFDLAFDGCDSLDENLNALKSNGGIHTFEKLYANLADKYVIMAPKEKFASKLNPAVPLTLEVLDQAILQIIKEVQFLGGRGIVRQSKDIAGMVRTSNGNGLIDCYFEDWEKIDQIDAVLTEQNGVLGTSYFKNLVTDALLASNNGVEHIKK